MSKDSLLSRRALLKAGALGTVAAGGAAALRSLNSVAQAQQTVDSTGGRVVGPGSHHDMVTVGELKAGSFDPSAYLHTFDTGKVSPLASGQTLREYTIAAGPGDRSRAGRILSGVDLQRHGSRSDYPLHRRRPGTDPFPERRQPCPQRAFPRDSSGQHGWGLRAGAAGSILRLRIRCRAVRPSALSLPYGPDQTAYPQGTLWRVPDRSQGRTPPGP